MATSKKVPVSKKKKADENRLARAMTGVLVIGVAVLLFLCFFVESEATLINRSREVMWGLGGIISVMIPVMMLWLGLLLTFSSQIHTNLQRYFSILFIVLCAATMLQLFQMQAVHDALPVLGKSQTYIEHIQLSYMDGMKMFRGGGAMGALLAYPLWLGLDIWGSMILLIVLILGALLICTDTSLVEIAGFFGLRFGEAKEQYEKWRDDREEQREAEKPKEKAQQRFVPMTDAADDDWSQPVAPKRGRGKKGQAQGAEMYAQTPQYSPQTQPGPYVEWKPVGNIVGFEDGDAEDMLFYPPQQEYYGDAPYGAQGDYAGGYPEYGQGYTEEVPLEDIEEYIEENTEQSTAHYAEDEAVYPRVLSFPTGREVLRPEESQGEAPAWEPDLGRSAYVPNYWEGPHRGAREAPPPAEDEDAFSGYPEEDAYPSRSYTIPDSAESPEETEASEQPKRAGRKFRLKKVPGTDEAQASPASAPVRPEPQLQAEAERRLDGSPLKLPQDQHREQIQDAPAVPYPYPPMRLLRRPVRRAATDTRAKDDANAKKLIGTLSSFGVTATVVGVSHGPAITRFEVQPAPGVKVSRIVGLVDDIALNMASAGVRIEAPIPGKAAVGIEIPNEVIETVTLSEVIDSEAMCGQKTNLACALGRDIAGNHVVADLAKMPHLLIAGATGSGKSVCINTLILSLLYRVSPEQVRMILIDPKVVELSVYNGVPHLLVPVVTDPKKASGALSWAVAEMERRYAAFAAYGVRDIRGYNEMPRAEGEESMPHILVVIDELADLMMVAPGEVEDSILRLAQKARAAGIHLVIATQRPSVNVITGVIKANIPSRIAFAVSSQVDSRTILDMAGAEKLLGKGDMLYAPQGLPKPLRVQGCFVSDEEVSQVVGFIKQRYEAEYNEDVEEYINAADSEDKAKDSGGDGPEAVDELLSKAVEIAVESGQASISMLQRRLRIGYARAGRIIDEMARRGIVAQAEGSKPREVLITREDFYRLFDTE